MIRKMLAPMRSDLKSGAREWPCQTRGHLCKLPLWRYSRISESCARVAVLSQDDNILFNTYRKFGISPHRVTGVVLFLLCTPCTLLTEQLPMKQKVLEAVSKNSIRILVKARRKCDDNIKSISRKGGRSSKAVFPNLFDVAVPLTSLFISHGTPWGKHLFFLNWFTS